MGWIHPRSHLRTERPHHEAEMYRNVTKYLDRLFRCCEAAQDTLPVIDGVGLRAKRTSSVRGGLVKGCKAEAGDNGGSHAGDEVG
jgi:5'-3' exonuclease